MNKLEISELMDKKIKNLNPRFKEKILLELMDDSDIVTLRNKNKIVSIIRKKLNILNSVSVNTPRYYTLRGWSVEEANYKAKTHNAGISRLDSVYRWQSWLTKVNPQTNKLYDEQEAKDAVAERRPTNIKYWTAKFNDIDIATAKWKEYQAQQSYKSNMVHYVGRMPTQVKYWTNRINDATGVNYTAKEAALMVAIRQNTTGIVAHINRQNDIQKGVRSYAETVKGAAKDALLEYLLDAIVEYNTVDDVLMKIHEFNTTIGSASTESLRYLGPMYTALCDDFDIYIGAYGKHELWLYGENGAKVRYDFAIPSHKLIIEYDGTGHFEGNGYNKRDIVTSKDAYKDNLAKSLGYTVCRVSIQSLTPTGIRLKILTALKSVGIDVPLEKLRTNNGYRKLKNANYEKNN